ncbi:MAG: TIGR03067 domain-containing protein, partial [Gemmataceae bacterium]|nr:TIGR03067 domain-containing protein [Gemmataceae bacterium]
DLTVGARPEVERDETAAAVQEEVDRLAAKYRDPVVLCFYQGHSHAEAAARLGWPVGTVASRLARAKDRLRDRLTRRGVALSAVVLSAGGSAAARADAALVRNTVTTVLGPAGKVPAGVLALTNGVVSAMRIAKLKVLAAGSAAAAVLAAGVFAAHGPGPGRGGGGGVGGGRSAARSDPPGFLDHLHALHDHLYRMVFGARADAPDEAAKKELKALEGEWRIVSLSADGKDEPADELAKARLTFKGGELEQREAGRDKVERLAVKLAPGESPRHFDLTALTGPDAVRGKTSRGIYKRDGDTVTVCNRDFAADADRPKEFEAGKGLNLLVLERVQDEKEELKALAGEWQATAASVSGVDDPAEVVKTLAWTITAEGRGTLTEGGQAVKADFAVDPAKAPAHLTTTLTDGPAGERGLALDGIYFRAGDKLIVAFADPKQKGAARPKELKPGDGVAFITLERKPKG